MTNADDGDGPRMTMAVEDQSMLGIFGMTVYELMAAEEYARALITDEHTVRAMKEFTDASPKADAFKSDAIRGTGAWKSDAGTMLMTSIFLDDPKKLDSFKLLLDQMLIKPPVYRDLADWWLFFAALEAATGFQLETCVGRKREGGLTTHLLEALGTQGKIWSAYIAEPVKRAGATLSISNIDLEVGGGEQATGGDFGLILDFDGKTVQPGAKKRPDDHRIVPLIFQAKRYARPTADISQSHPKRGPQHTLLGRNDCAAAYIFYENLKHAPIPLPPLVKRVENVPGPTTTDVLDQSLDFATYLLRAAIDPVYAPRAHSTDDALRMIFKKAAPQDLTKLVVVSNDPGAGNRYRSGFGMLKHQLKGYGDEPDFVHQEN